MIIRIALAAPFGLGIFSSLMLIAGKPGYAVAFLCYLFMMVALAVKPPAAIARRLGVEVEEKEQEEREPSEPGEGLLAKIKTLPALVIAFFSGLTAKWAVMAKPPFIRRKDDKDEEDAAPVAAPAPPVEAPQSAASVAEAPAEASAPADAPVVVPAPVAVAVRGLETEPTGRLVMALLGRFKFWRAPLPEDEMVAEAAVSAVAMEAEGVADDEEYEEASLTAKPRALGVVLLRMLGKLRKSKVAVDDLAGDDLIAEAALSAASPEDLGNLVELPPVELSASELPITGVGGPAKVSLVGKLLAMVKAIGGKMVVRDSGAAPTGAMEKPVVAGASRRGSLLGKVIPGLRAAASKVVVASGDAAVVQATPRRPLKESLASVVPSVTAAVLAAVAWARGVREDDWVPIAATGWRVGGMATLMVLALPLLAVDLGVMRYRIRKEERAEARATPEEPDAEDLLLDTLVSDEGQAIAA